MIDTTITIGNIIETVVIAAGGLLFVLNLRNEIRLFKAEMAHLKSSVRTDLDNLKSSVVVLNSAFDKLGTILTQVAVQDTRLNSVENDIRELRHGEGFIRGRGGIDKEYGG